MKPNVIAGRIAERIMALDTNPSAVAVEAGLGRSAVRDILAGKAKKPQADTVAALARVLKCSVAYLMGETDDPTSARSDSFADYDPQMLPINAILEAGVYRESGRYITASESGLAPLENFAYKDLRVKGQMIELFEMGDNSLVYLHIMKGDILTTATEFLNDNLRLKDGMVVVCNYTLKEAGLRERCARVVEIEDGRIRLTFGSDDIRHKVLTFPEPDYEHYAGEYGFDVEQGGSVFIEGIVVRVTRSMKIVM